MRLINRIFVHCSASSQKWGVKELWEELARAFVEIMKEQGKDKEGKA